MGVGPWKDAVVRQAVDRVGADVGRELEIVDCQAMPMQLENAAEHRRSLLGARGQPLISTQVRQGAERVSKQRALLALEPDDRAEHQPQRLLQRRVGRERAKPRQVKLELR
jgi:hypothetical protein